MTTTAPAAGVGAGRQRLNLLPDTEFDTAGELRSYCNLAKGILRDLAMEVDFDARMLDARLREVRSHSLQVPAHARARARNTVSPLYRAVDALVFAAEMLVKCYAQFERNYAPELDAARGRNRPAGRPMRMEE